jgi:hypothetical protein
MGLVRPRWPSIAALMSLFVGIAAWQIVPTAMRDYRDSQQQQADAKLEKSLKPAMTALSRLKVTGLTSCRGHRGHNRHRLCGRSGSNAVSVTMAMRRSLIDIGVRQIVANCVATRLASVTCQLVGELT